MEELKQYLKENPNEIEKILKYFKYHSISINNEEIRCAKPNGDNASSIRIKLNDKLSSTDFSSSYSGDLFSLIATHTGLKYSEAIKTVQIMIGKKINGTYENKEESLFDGFFDDLYIPYETEEKEVIYDESILDKYNNGYKWNIRFLKDGILPSSQVKFNIGFSEDSNRITLPWKDSEGNIVGVMGRIDNDIPTNFKYIPLIPFPKHKYLYGLYQNKEHIKESKEVYIFESEKSVLLGDSLNYRNFASLGGNSISTTQVEQILKLGVNKIVICLDEGLDTEIIKKDIKTIKECLFMRDCKVGFILDKDNKYLPKGGKDSPIDLGKDAFEGLLKDCLIIN